MSTMRWAAGPALDGAVIVVEGEVAPVAGPVRARRLAESAVLTSDV
jgi:hypothetical protein